MNCVQMHSQFVEIRVLEEGGESRWWRRAEKRKEERERKGGIGGRIKDLIFARWGARSQEVGCGGSATPLTHQLSLESLHLLLESLILWRRITE